MLPLVLKMQHDATANSFEVEVAANMFVTRVIVDGGIAPNFQRMICAWTWDTSKWTNSWIDVAVAEGCCDSHVSVGFILMEEARSGASLHGGAPRSLYSLFMAAVQAESVRQQSLTDAQQRARSIANDPHLAYTFVRSDIVSFVGQMLIALAALHSGGLIHRDLSTTNVLLDVVHDKELHCTLTSDTGAELTFAPLGVQRVVRMVTQELAPDDMCGGYRLALIDLGSAHEYMMPDVDAPVDTRHCQAWTRPPEQFFLEANGNSPFYMPAGDLWSVGMLMLTMTLEEWVIAPTGNGLRMPERMYNAAKRKLESLPTMKRMARTFLGERADWDQLWTLIYLFGVPRNRDMRGVESSPVWGIVCRPMLDAAKEDTKTAHLWQDYTRGYLMRPGVQKTLRGRLGDGGVAVLRKLLSWDPKNRSQARDILTNNARYGAFWGRMRVLTENAQCSAQHYRNESGWRTRTSFPRLMNPACDLAVRGAEALGHGAWANICAPGALSRNLYGELRTSLDRTPQLYPAQTPAVQHV